jgi:phosphoenolpyruvate---glycerone phosphotransferase subunit DhaL
MGRAQLDLEATRAMFLHVAHGLEASKDHLSDLDRAIGDGDHGIGMARGFEAVRRDLGAKSYDSVGKLLHGVGTALMMSMGGASGAIFGSLFRGASAKLQEERSFTSGTLACLLVDGLQAVKARGGAQAGAKTMIDALEPASVKAQALAEAGAPLDRALAAACEEARLGMERTKDMVATTGRAKTLGDRSLGHLDPGAASTYLILKFMEDFVALSAAAAEA